MSLARAAQPDRCRYEIGDANEKRAVVGFGLVTLPGQWVSNWIERPVEFRPIVIGQDLCGQ